MQRARIIDMGIVVLMILFAAVQFNDNDGIIWIAAYLAVALAAMLHYIGKSSKFFNRSLLVLYVLVLSYYMPQLVAWFADGMPSIVGSMQASTPYIELVREAGGILICILVMLYYTTRKY